MDMEEHESEAKQELLEEFERRKKVREELVMILTG